MYQSSSFVLKTHTFAKILHLFCFAVGVSFRMPLSFLKME